MQARFERAGVRIEGKGVDFVRNGDSGRRVTFTFCPCCGATVHYVLEGWTDHVGIPVGVFADPAFAAPTSVRHEDCAHPWVELNLPGE